MELVTCFRFALAGLVTFSLSAASAAAAPMFQRTDTSLTARPDSMAVGDMDGVKGPDVLLSFYNGASASQIGVLLNQGNASFGPVQNNLRVENPKSKS